MKNVIGKNPLEEVLAPVPTYEEYKELLDLNVYDKLQKENKKLQEQLKEANEILRMYSAYCYEVQDGKIISEEKSPATIYFEKWGVK